MELEVVCGCGQKYKFDVEPANGRMPVRVNCPVCGADGTESANSLLTQQFSSQSPPIPVAMTASAAGLRINQPAPAPAAASRADAPLRSPAAPAAPIPKMEKEYSLPLGILGAILGAALGAGLMYGFFLLADFRFPLMGTGIGALTGLGARILARGTDMTLGTIAGVIALLSTAGTLYLMFGGVRPFTSFPSQSAFPSPTKSQVNSGESLRLRRSADFLRLQFYIRSANKK